MSDDRVILRKTGWRALPLAIRERISKDVERVRVIREDIKNKSRVIEMPPVQLFPVAWATESAAVPGRSGTMECDGFTEFGVELSAAAILYASDEAVRGILLHEFSHCFFHARQVLDSLDRGETGLDLAAGSPDAHDDEWDRSRMDPPELWFCPEDVAIFPYHDSPLLEECSIAVVKEWILKGLPAEPPTRRFTGSNFGIPASIVAHIKANPLPGGQS